MIQTYCSQCDELVQVRPFLVYFNFIGFFVGYCPDCGILVYEKPASKSRPNHDW